MQTRSCSTSFSTAFVLHVDPVLHLPLVCAPHRMVHRRVAHHAARPNATQSTYTNCQTLYVNKSETTAEVLRALFCNLTYFLQKSVRCVNHWRIDRRLKKSVSIVTTNSIERIPSYACLPFEFDLVCLFSFRKPSHTAPWRGTYLFEARTLSRLLPGERSILMCKSQKSRIALVWISDSDLKNSLQIAFQARHSTRTPGLSLSLSIWFGKRLLRCIRKLNNLA